jgi:hypothetical protein
MRSSSRFKKVAAALQRSISRLFNNTVVPSIPVDVLLAILEHVDKATLVKMCRLNKVCCSYSQDVLYREIRISRRSDLRVYQTLSQSTDLARRVRSFKAPYNDDDPDLYGALQNMINLRRLDLGYSNLLEGYTNIDDLPEFGATFLPNLTRVAAPFFKLPQLIPNRPVTEVISLGNMGEIIPVDLNFFALSNSPIQKLKIDYSYLYPKSGQYLTSIFSSLTTLEITANTYRFLAIVRESPF